MKKFNNFLTQMFSGANNRISSKRVFGAGILTLLTLAVIVNMFIDNSPAWLGEAILMLIGVAAGLLGLGVLEKPHKNNKEDNNDEDNG